MRLIDADALLNALQELAFVAQKNEEYDRLIGIGYSKDAVCEAPTIDAVPIVHGRWRRMSEKGFWIKTCSVCNAKTSETFGLLGNAIFNYCPNCGAMMDEKQEDE